ARLRPGHRLDRAGLLLRAGGRGWTEPEDLLLPCRYRSHRIRLLRVGRLEGPARALEAGRGSGPRELRCDSPGRDLRCADTRDRLDLGALPLGTLVGMARRPACAVSGAVPLLCRVLHAALLGSPRAASLESQRRLRTLR